MTAKDEFIWNQKRRSAFVKYKLELQGNTLKELSKHLDLHFQGLYRKLIGENKFRIEEADLINKYLNLTKAEIKELWENKSKLDQ